MYACPPNIPSVPTSKPALVTSLASILNPKNNDKEKRKRFEPSPHFLLQHRDRTLRFRMLGLPVDSATKLQRVLKLIPKPR